MAQINMEPQGACVGLLLGAPCGGFPKLGVPFLGVPIITDYSILGSIFGSPYFGKLPCKFG